MMTPGQVAARDVKPGHYVTGDSPQGFHRSGMVTLAVTEWGATYIWLEPYPNGLRHERRAADLILNHGDPVKVARHRAS